MEGGLRRLWSELTALYEPRDQYIRDNIGLVKTVVQKYRSPKHHHFDDMLQVGMVGLMRAYDTKDERSSGSTWAYANIKYAVLHYLDPRRGRKNPLTLNQEEGIGLSLDVEIHEGVTFGDLIGVSDDYSAVDSDFRDLLESTNDLGLPLLTDHQKLVLTRHFRDDKMYVDIAREMGVSSQTVWQSARTAIEKLRKQMEVERVQSVR